jgi:hypothetical protein
VPYKVIGRCQRFGEYIISIFKAEVTMMRNWGIFMIRVREGWGRGANRSIATSAAKVETVCLPQTLASADKSTR